MMSPAVRVALADAVRWQLPAGVATVLPYGVVGPFQPPCVVLGQPDVEFGDWLCTDKVTVGLAVVVRDHPEGPAATQQSLETLWPQVAAAVKAALHSDQTLGGLVTTAQLVRADFGDFMVQGTPYPAQNLTIEIYL